MPYTLAFVAMVALFLVATTIAVMSRYHRCPSNQILVKYGNVGRDKAALPIHGGATFVWPVLQSYAFLDLTPMTIDIDLKGALSKQNIRMNVPSRFTIGIATDEEGMNNAAVRLLGESQQQIEALAKDIIFGQLRATIATMNIEEINAEREIFEQKVTNNVETELKKIGLRFINVNIADVQDESLYLQSLGKRAAAEAVNAAKVAVADQDRSGAVGAAEADREQRCRASGCRSGSQAPWRCRRSRQSRRCRDRGLRRPDGDTGSAGRNGAGSSDSRSGRSRGNRKAAAGNQGRSQPAASATSRRGQGCRYQSRTPR